MPTNFDSHAEAQKIDKLKKEVCGSLNSADAIPQYLAGQAFCKEMASIWGDPEKLLPTVSELQKNGNGLCQSFIPTVIEGCPPVVTKLEIVDSPGILQLHSAFEVEKVGNKIQASYESNSKRKIIGEAIISQSK